MFPRFNTHANISPRSCLSAMFPRFNTHANISPRSCMAGMFPRFNTHANISPRSCLSGMFPRFNTHANIGSRWLIGLATLYLAWFCLGWLFHCEYIHCHTFIVNSLTGFVLWYGSDFATCSTCHTVAEVTLNVFDWVTYNYVVYGCVCVCVCLSVCMSMCACMCVSFCVYSIIGWQRSPVVCGRRGCAPHIQWSPEGHRVSGIPRQIPRLIMLQAISTCCRCWVAAIW